MNLVKGVADLIRRSSAVGGASGAGDGTGARSPGIAASSGGGGSGSKLALPSARVRFGDKGEEAILNVLWQRYERALDMAEKRKSLHVFLLHVIQTYENWNPPQSLQLASRGSESEEIVVGCFGGHPSEVILVLVQEIARVAVVVNELGNGISQTNSIPSIHVDHEMMDLLKCLTILTRSVHNGQVFGYYGGVQKTTALLKASVVQLKTLTCSLAADEQLSSSIANKINEIQNLAIYIVVVLYNFMGVKSMIYGKGSIMDIIEDQRRNHSSLEPSRNLSNDADSDHLQNWQQKAIVLVMEAGGVNWLVELLRVIRRLNLKEQWADLTLQFLTLGTLRLAISENVRAQNHFRSIGGLEVLLDGLGLQSSKFSVSNAFIGEDGRSQIFYLQILSLEVLRESVYGNVNNMQFLCENGRLHKFANSICWPAFMIQEIQSPKVDTETQSPSLKLAWGSYGESSQTNTPNLKEWNDYTKKLTRALCSFLLPPEVIEYYPDESPICQTTLLISSTYLEISVRWIIKVLITVFPCIEACANEVAMPDHIRILGSTLQHYILYAFRKMLISGPALLDALRREGAWDLIFAERFFNFGQSVEKLPYQSDLGVSYPVKKPCSSDVPYHGDEALVDIQMEAISFLEFCATLNGISDNTPECAVLLDLLERFARIPGVANIVLKSMSRILKQSTDQTLIAFQSLNAVSRVLAVGCVQGEEQRKLESLSGLCNENSAVQICHKEETMKSLLACMQSAFELFKEYLATARNGRITVLHNATTVQLLFDLFWEKTLRTDVLEEIVGLFLIPPSSTQDHLAKSQLCYKYLEAFNCAKEKELYFAEVSVDLLSSMREIILTDCLYYQTLFCNGECLLHIVSLLNGTPDAIIGEQLVLNILQTLTLLLAGNDDTKAALRALVGVGYQTLQSLLLDFCKSVPSQKLLDALLDMLVDGTFEIDKKSSLKNEDALVLFINVLKKSSTLLQHYGLDTLQKMLKESISNRTSCTRAGLLSFLLDWFSVEDRDDTIFKIAELIQIIGGHSIAGKDIRKIFALLRGEKINSKLRHNSLLVTSISKMLKEKGPEAFFEFNGCLSGIEIKTPVQWSSNRGFSFTCWLRVETFPENTLMGLFSFFTDSGKGFSAMLGKGTLVYESVTQKHQCILLPLNLIPERWNFLSITHSIGRAFTGGSLLKCYVNGELVSSQKCSYAKVNDPMVRCTVAAELMPIGEEPNSLGFERTCPFTGQMGPIYVFTDALSSEQIKGIFNLGPSYMYSFLGDQNSLMTKDSAYNGILESKDGLSTKINFALNSQASENRTLFSISCALEGSERKMFEATIMDGTKLCSRHLLQEIIYCVGGVSVFFPLVAQPDKDFRESGISDYGLHDSSAGDRRVANLVELVASFLDDNISNQQQMHLISGFGILGYLLQTVPPQQMNSQTLASLKYMFDVLRNCSMSDVLFKEALSKIYLNYSIWVYTNYEVQRDLYMFLIQYFESDESLLPALCGLPRIIDIIHQYYWEMPENSTSVGPKPCHPVAKKVIGQRPSLEEIRKIRLLLLSLAEMSLRQKVSPADINALTAFFETSQDMACVEDMLHMVIRALSQKSFMTLFLDQVNALGGCQIFVSLLNRELEPIRLLGLQLLGKLLVGPPSEKKEASFFSLPVGRPKFISEYMKRVPTAPTELIIPLMSERLFKHPISDHLCATLFDVTLGGASPKQVLQKRSQLDATKNKNINSAKSSCQFHLPQILAILFKFLQVCNSAPSRMKILGDLLDLLDSNPSNIEALMEHSWRSWLETTIRLDIIRDHKLSLIANTGDFNVDEVFLVRNVYSLVLSYYLYSVKGGWHHVEDTINFLLLNAQQGALQDVYLLRGILEDVIESLLEVSSEENIFMSQPCHDNVLYLLKLIDELLTNEIGIKLLFRSLESLLQYPIDDVQRDICLSVNEALTSEGNYQQESFPWKCGPVVAEDYGYFGWWNLYDKVWILISSLYGKGPSKIISKGSNVGGPTLGQRARGLVESLNIPAAEMAAVVVSGGITTALGGRANKYVDKAMILRGERCPRVIFHLVVLYICKASLEDASKCVQQFISLLPSLLTSDDELGKNRLHFFIWSLLTARTVYGRLDDGARFHVISHVILETVLCGKSIFASILNLDDSTETSNTRKEAGFILSLIQKDRILVAAVEEARYVKSTNLDRLNQLKELRLKLDERYNREKDILQTFEELQRCKNAALAADESRKVAFLAAQDEEQQVVRDKCIHIFRSLIDERGPWSANPFPNKALTHWKLDRTEDKWRRRIKLKRNYKFDERLCHPPSIKSADEKLGPVDDLPSEPDRTFSSKMRTLLLKGVHGIAEEQSSESIEDLSLLVESNSSGNSQSKTLVDTIDSSEPVNAAQDNKESLGSKDNNDSNEVILTSHCIVVSPKRKLAGYLTVTRNILHFSFEFLVEGTGGTSVFRRFQDRGNTDLKIDEQGGIEKQTGDLGKESTSETCDNQANDQSSKIKRHRRWNLSRIKAVHWIRYLLQYTALEIFFDDSTAPVFLNFACPKDAKHAGTMIVSLRNEALFPKGSYKDKSGFISLVDRRSAVELAENARERWRRREISNFEYLMILNTVAGRSYNDLTQYPVFPWILSDYSSEKLDFNKSSTFRDLSKPIGALDEKRFKVFEDRYLNFSDPDIPSFYFGSHYSSMGIVLYYLLRLEPFTSLHRNLQGGKFDHADRLFQSIASTYKNCLSNTSDVKELIPEFFYMPEFLQNLNAYHFGVKQDGEPLGDVVLPPWAKGSPEEFISLNREALESEYVSSNLHQWIDLVFGYKQRGKPAVEAANIFYYLTYEGAVDLENMDDMLEKSAIEDQIANFGQTPIQIFRKKHPRRGPPIPIAHPLYFAPGSITLTSTLPTTTSPPSSVLFVGLLDSSIVLVNEGLIISSKLWLTTQLQSGGNFTFSGSQEPFFGIGADILPARKIATPLAENLEFGRQCVLTMQIQSENYLVLCGNWDYSFRIISLADGRFVQSIRQHKDVVSCAAVSSNGSVVATGSYDTTVMVWHVLPLKSNDRRSRTVQAETLTKDRLIKENPVHILCGHDDVITCLFISTELDIVISGSKDGTCIFHTLRSGVYVRSIQHPSGSSLSRLVASEHGKVAFYSDDDLSLHLYSINGKHLASYLSNARLNCLELSGCGEFIVCASDQGQILLHSMHSLDVVWKYECADKTISALAVTSEECFIAGTKDGCLLVYSIENPMFRKATVPRSKPKSLG